jgi:hypothetical protein
MKRDPEELKKTGLTEDDGLPSRERSLTIPDEVSVRHWNEIEQWLGGFSGKAFLQLGGRLSVTQHFVCARVQSDPLASKCRHIDSTLSHRFTFARGSRNHDRVAPTFPTIVPNKVNCTR